MYARILADVCHVEYVCGEHIVSVPRAQCAAVDCQYIGMYIMPYIRRLDTGSEEVTTGATAVSPNGVTCRPEDNCIRLPDPQFNCFDV